MLWCYREGQHDQCRPPMTQIIAIVQYKTVLNQKRDQAICKHRKAVLFLFHEAAPHLWQFDFDAPFIDVLTYLLTYLQGGICREGTCPGHWISRYGTKWPVLCWCATANPSHPPSLTLPRNTTLLTYLLTSHRRSAQCERGLRRFAGVYLCATGAALDFVTNHP